MVGGKTRTRRRFKESKRTRIMEETREQGWERGTKEREEDDFIKVLLTGQPRPVLSYWVGPAGSRPPAMIRIMIMMMVMETMVTMVIVLVVDLLQ